MHYRILKPGANYNDRYTNILTVNFNVSWKKHKYNYIKNVTFRLLEM